MPPSVPSCPSFSPSPPDPDAPALPFDASPLFSPVFPPPLIDETSPTVLRFLLDVVLAENQQLIYTLRQAQQERDASAIQSERLQQRLNVVEAQLCGRTDARDVLRRQRDQLRLTLLGVSSQKVDLEQRLSRERRARQYAEEKAAAAQEQAEEAKEAAAQVCSARLADRPEPECDKEPTKMVLRPRHDKPSDDLSLVSPPSHPPVSALSSPPSLSSLTHTLVTPLLTLTAANASLRARLAAAEPAASKLDEALSLLDELVRDYERVREEKGRLEEEVGRWRRLLEGEEGGDE
ncbi:hypothetical protein JCM6882_002211 [Rhodosporidiobolus microsporus]